jgi:hypothetical protein
MFPFFQVNSPFPCLRSFKNEIYLVEYYKINKFLKLNKKINLKIILGKIIFLKKIKIF